MNIFLITSVIKITDDHFDKSFCQHTRRQHDTLKTIYSIKQNRINEICIYILYNLSSI